MIARHQVDPKTKTIITHYGDQSFFIVYVKRHNGRKVVMRMGSGADIAGILRFYNDLKVMRHDRKYLYHRLSTEPVSEEKKVLMENGKGERREIARTGRKKINYAHGEIPAIKHIPRTILKDASAFINRGYTVNGTKMNKTRLISILLAEFLERDEMERIEYLTINDLLLEKHKLNSGGFDEERIDQVNLLENHGIEDSDDLEGLL